MAGFSAVNIPGEAIGHSRGLAVFNAASDSELVPGEGGTPIAVGRLRVQTVLAEGP